MGQRFAAESALALDWDSELARNTLWAMLHYEQMIVLVYQAGSVIAGLVMGSVERDFFVQSSAYVTKFYVEQEFRGLSVADELVAAFEREAKSMGASVIFAAATAGMGPTVERLYVRLFERAGFRVLGRVLTKEI